MRRGIVVLVVGPVLVAGACRASTADPTLPAPEIAPPTVTAATSTSSSSTSTTVPATTTTTVPAAYPVTVESDLGPVIIETEPSRIVSLSATHTEMLYAVGAGGRVIATDLTSNFPTEAASTVKLDSFSFNVEEVAALEPDLVILAFDFQGEADALSALGIPFLLLGPPPSLEAAFSQLLNVGAATGHVGEADDLADNLTAEAERIIAASAPIRGVSFFHEVDETFFSASSESFIGDLYHRLGLVNIADDAEPGGPFPQLSSEFIVDRDPEFIFLADANFGVTADLVAARPGWNTITAVQEGNVVELDGDIAGRWGPRTVDLLASIFEAVAAVVP